MNEYHIYRSNTSTIQIVKGKHNDLAQIDKSNIEAIAIKTNSGLKVIWQPKKGKYNEISRSNVQQR